MIDREKVIKGLECCILHNPDDHARCMQCPYESNCVNRLKMDALELLNEQEPVSPKKDYDLNELNMLIDVYYCGNCGEKIIGKGKYCSSCGKAVKWDDT